MYDVIQVSIVRNDRHLEHHDTRLQARLPAVSNRTFGRYMVYNYSDNTENFLRKGDVTRDDSQRRFLAQHIVAMLEQCFVLVVSDP